MSRNDPWYQKYALYIIIILVLVVIDQMVKLWVFHNMTPGSAGEINILGDFFKLHFVQNPGMAFGIKWDSTYGKLVLSILRLGITVGLIAYFIISVKKGAPKLLLISLSLIIAGALGNGIDSTFYGIFLDNAPSGSPMKFLHGKVVDMFHADIWKGRVGESVPLIGGKYLSLWPIFNIADAVVSVGVIIILLFQKRLFEQPGKPENEQIDLSEESTESGYPE